MIDLLRNMAALRGEDLSHNLSKIADYIEAVKVNPCGLRYRDGYVTMKGQCGTDMHTRWYLVDDGEVGAPMTLADLQVKLLTERAPF